MLVKKESKNLGISKSCPACRKTIIRDSNFSGTGYFHMKCPHCKTLIKIDVNPKTTLSLKIVLLAIIVLIASFSVFVSITKNPTITLEPYAR